ncbi:MAG TPA: hypothetical protein VE978_22740 [Chitinophagales bacterium]|nr:hypothetical protein [Chitinophagales bacterium]
MTNFNFWLLAIAFLSLQESVTTAGIMQAAYREGHNIILFTLIFLMTTLSEILIFYRIGKYLQLKGRDSKAILWAKNYIAKADNFIGTRGEELFLVFLSASVFPPSITSFIASWLKLSFQQSFICILIGNILWYVLSWMIVISVGYFVGDAGNALLAVLGIAFIIVLIQKFLSRKVSE